MSSSHVAIELHKGGAGGDKGSDATADKNGGSHWTDTAYHNVTAMVGAGVLGLPATFAILGWAGGLIVLIVSLGISWFTFGLLVYLHEDDNDARYNRYHELCESAWGKGRGKWIVHCFQLPFLYGLAVTYTVTGAQNLANFAALVHTNGESSDTSYFFNQSFWIMIFSAVEVLIAQVPDLGSLGWVSGVGAVMSVMYSVGGSALALNSPRTAEVNYDPRVGAEGQPQVQQVLNVFSAITTILFAFGGHNIALEIQAILPSPPSTVRPMMKGVHTAFVLTIICYLLVSITGFYAFGTSVEDNVLGSAGNNPLGLLLACHFAVVLHVMASYQVYSFPIFELVEISLAKIAAPAAAAAAASVTTASGAKAGDASQFGRPSLKPSTSINSGAQVPGSQGLFKRASRAIGLEGPDPGPEGDAILTDHANSSSVAAQAASQPALDGISQPAGGIIGHSGAATSPPSTASKLLYFLGPVVRRQVIRLVYIATTCFLASLIPFFGDLMGLIGAVGVTPTTFVLPCLLWLTIKRPATFSGIWWLCWTISFVAGTIGVLGFIGSMYSIIQHAQSYKLFGAVGR